MNIDYKLIGNRIKLERKKKGITQERMAELLDVSIGYVSQVERGITKISLDLLAAISTALECDVSSLITESASMSDYYMLGEFSEKYAKLSKDDKRIVMGLIELMLNK